MTVAIFISTLIIIMGAPAVVWKTEEAGMEATGIYMGVIKTALEKYNIANHDALSLTVPLPIAGFPDPLAPTIDQLKTAKYIASPSFPSFTPQRLQVNTRITRANCPGSNCQIIGYAFTTTPLTYAGTTEPRYDLVAAYLASPGAGGSGVASHYGASGVLRSATYNVPNPVAGTPGGIIGIATFLDEGIFARFVKIQDTRDPDLQGPLTVAGQVTGKSPIGTSDGVAACLRAAMTTGGQVLANSTNCIRRAYLDGTNGQAGVADATGNTRVLLEGNTGGLSSFDSTGRNAAGIRYNGANQSVLYADNMQNSAGTAGVRADGSLYGTRAEVGTVNISNSATAGAACAIENDVVQGTVGGSPLLLICRSGVWSSTSGSPIASAGSACVVAGAPGISPAGVGLICVGGQWMPNTQRFGRFAATDNYSNVTHGTGIEKPFCPGGGDPKIYFVPQGVVGAKFDWSAGTTYYASNFRAIETATTFIAVVDDTINYNAPGGNMLPGYSLAITGCYYNI
ncbi:hypothetical protein LP417_35330 (plasmid) [Polaromonas sp. P1-6]|nr:hypothetical protein LP417_35330 [Polaromonas sp. P1-6]